MGWPTIEMEAAQGARTTNAALQSKLDYWAGLCEQGQKKAFIEDFCSPDIPSADKEHFLTGLEADNDHWNSFASEIVQVARPLSGQLGGISKSKQCLCSA